MNNELIKGEIVEISLDNIIPNRFQPRLQFDEGALNELAKSIRMHGIIQPLVLRKIGNKYEIIAGERRYKAAYIAGLTKVPAVIIDLNDNESAEVAIVENLQRQDLSAIEEAKSYKKLLDRGYLTQEELAGRMGKTQATISNKLRLLNLTKEVQDALLENKISERHARSLLRLEDPNVQRNMLNEIIEKRLNVKLTEERINEILNGNTFVKEEIKEEIPMGQINPIDIDKKIPSIKPIEEVKENDNFINPSFNNEIKQQEENPISLIRPIIQDTQTEEELVTPMPKQIDNINQNIKTITDVESKVNGVIEQIKDLGFGVKLEEYDFDNVYQFVIKVDKK